MSPREVPLEYILPKKISLFANYPKDVLECPICWEEKSSEDFQQLMCGHKPCQGCLETMTNYSMLEKTASYLVCPFRDCVKPLTIPDIQKITDGPALKVITKLVDQQNPDYKSCPHVDCKGYFIDIYGVGKIIKCTECKSVYCSKCLKNHKANISCDKAARLLLGQNNDEDKEKQIAEDKDKQLVKELSKKCPKCPHIMVKDGGCAKMKCPYCKASFNWNTAHSPK